MTNPNLLVGLADDRRLTDPLSVRARALSAPASIPNYAPLVAMATILLGGLRTNRTAQRDARRNLRSCLITRGPLVGYRINGMLVHIIDFLR